MTKPTIGEWGLYIRLSLAQRGDKAKAIKVLELILERLENNSPLSPSKANYLINAIREILPKNGIELVANITHDANKALLLKPSAKQRRKFHLPNRILEFNIAGEIEKERLLHNNFHKEEGGALSIVAKKHGISPSKAERIYNSVGRERLTIAARLKMEKDSEKNK